MSGIAQRLLTTVVLAMLFACSDGGFPKGKEIASSSAPDGGSRAVVWAVETLELLGATNSQVYEVWVQLLTGDKPQELILRADRTEGLKVTWRDSRTLEICYGPSHITDFRNFFEYGEQHSQKLYQVEISLRRANRLDDCK